MKGLVLTSVGLEDVSAEEINSLCEVSNLKTGPGRILFEVKSKEELATLCYYGRTFSKVVLLLSEFKSSIVPEPKNMPDVGEFLKERAVVNCDRFGEHDFTSFDVQTAWNGYLGDTYKVAIDHKKPQTTFHLVIDNDNCFFGVDFSGIDLGKREYRIFLGTNALKGNIAAALLFIAGFKPSQSLLDPFCRHGIVPIEAALLATNTSVHRLAKEKLAFTNLPDFKYEFKDKPEEFEGTIIAMDDNFKHVSASKKNAKIAGVTKAINFSRTDLQWLDTKFGKHFIDHIITLPLQPGRTITEAKAEKVYREFFYQAEFILKKSGKVCLCMARGMDLAKKKASEFKFKLEKELTVMQGKERLTVLLFSR